MNASRANHPPQVSRNRLTKANNSFFDLDYGMVSSAEVFVAVPALLDAVTTSKILRPLKVLRTVRSPFVVKAVQVLGASLFVG